MSAQDLTFLSLLLLPWPEDAGDEEDELDSADESPALGRPPLPSPPPGERVAKRVRPV